MERIVEGLSTSIDRRRVVCRKGMVVGVLVLLACSTHAWADDALLTLGDFILAIDQDTPVSGSSYPAAEGPAMILDNVIFNTETSTASKYLNYAKENSGFIVTPTVGPSTVRSMVIWTANDHEERDPATFAIYGTNDPIVSREFDLGTAENWTLIATGDLALPADRNTAGPAVSFDNEVAYTSYKVLFPTLKNTAVANSMQIAEVAMYDTKTPDETSVDILDSGATILGIDADTVQWGIYPTARAEGPAYCIDGDPATKYLNFGEVNSGFIVTPSAGLTIVTSFQMTTANDSPERDPAGWALYGTTNAIASTDNSKGDQEAWTLIASGTVDLPTDRSTAGPIVSFTNTTAYNSYRMIFTSVRDAALANSMQIAEIQFYGTKLSEVPDMLLTPGDPVVAVDISTSASYTPVAEVAANVLDGVPGTKYLNYAKDNSGIIVTPASGSSVVRSIKLTSANDHPERDPASFALYGTNDPILSRLNSTGTAENWTLISTGNVSLLDTPRLSSIVIGITNEASYKSYKLLFPTLKVYSTGTPPAVVTPNSMQIADVGMYTTADGSGTNVLATGDAILAINGTALSASQSTYPTTEPPANAIDRIIATSTGGTSKYLNKGMLDSGFIVTPSVGLTKVTAFRIWTANDSESRDPVGWELYGTDDPIVSGDNSFGNSENWALIASGAMSGNLVLPSARKVAGPMIEFPNETFYTSYRIVFPTLKFKYWTGTAWTNQVPNSMQIADIQFYGKIQAACATPFADLDGDQDVDQVDFGLFQTCYTTPWTTVTSRMCRCVDKGKDGMVDAIDLIQFSNCYTGPMIPWTQALTPSCSP